MRVALPALLLLVAATAACAALVPLRHAALAAALCGDMGLACAAGATCCGELCCPLAGAECCADSATCCAAGLTCHPRAPGRCLDPRVARPAPADGSRVCADGAFPYYDAAQDACVRPLRSQAVLAAAQQTWAAWAGLRLGLVRENTCPDGTECTNSQTCCQLTTGAYGCCPYVDASCCPDKINCCPSGYRCTLDAIFCLPNSASVTALTKPLYVAMAQRSAGGGALDGCESNTCLDGDTCCPQVDGSSGCCPYTDAQCCLEDRDYCCPNGYNCDIAHKRCVKQK